MQRRLKMMRRRPSALSRTAMNRRSAADRAGWVAPAWFFLGIVVGIAAFAAYTIFWSPSPPRRRPSTHRCGAGARGGAPGVLEAIATLQAGGGQPAAQDTGPAGGQPATPLRCAMQIVWAAAAKVTVVEFSDFQ